MNTPGARAWCALAALLMVAALAGLALPRETLDWQPALAGAQPWRWWTAVAVHYSTLHIAANLAGLGLVAALGVVAAVPSRSAAAWALAWPATQLALLARPDLAHYGGLSGVLHAGVAVAALHLILDDRGRRRAIGSVILAMLLAKLLSETPWGPAVRHPEGWDIAVAPFAHAAGTACGLFFAALARFVSPSPRPHA